MTEIRSGKQKNLGRMAMSLCMVILGNVLYLGRMAMSLCMVILGNVLYALTVKLFLLPAGLMTGGTVKLFLLPAGLMTGGTTGIALMVEHLTGLPVSWFVLGFNMLMLAAGYVCLGKAFAATTVVSTFVYPLALEFFHRTLGNLTVTDELLPAAWISRRWC